MPRILTEEERKQRKEKQREYKRIYMKNYNLTHNRIWNDMKTRANPEYKERERLRSKERYLKQKFFRMFKRAMPHFLTA